ncbi:MAG: hypothetical protein Q4D53_00900 [Leptotrichiaceae bacterium]|nr:hypothetical protein [Leptotrichiaceae bacterium]
MIGNLFDYEFKITAKLLFPLYISALAVSFLNKLIYLFTDTGIEKFLYPGYDENFGGVDSVVFSFQILSYAVLGFIIMGIFTLTYFILISRYCKSMYGNEGYLTNTLPIKSHQLILIKFLNFWIWLFAGSIVMIISIFLILPDSFSTNFIWRMLTSNIIFIFSSFAHAGFITLSIFKEFVYCNRNILIIFLAAAIANFSNNYKLLSGIAFFFIIKLLLGMISYAVIKIPSVIFLYVNNNADFFSSEFFISFDILFGIIQCIVIFFITNHIHKNHLNLE